MIRRVREADVPAVVHLVHELARYEDAQDQCHLTTERLHTALFGTTPALFGHVAESDGQVVGFALWFLNFSTWEGAHGIYLEDLFVQPAQRGSGLGGQLLAELARECVRCDYARMEWSVLNWNESAIGFYRAAGAVPLEEWTGYRLSGQALRDFGNLD